MIDVQTLIHQVKTGLDEGKSEAELFQSLTPHLNQNAELDRKLLESLGGLPDAKIARLLQRLLEMSKDKRVRREIKRSLYRLKTKGVAVEELASDRGTSILRPLQAEHSQGFGGAIDPLGHRFLLLGIPHPGRGLSLIQGVISDTEGWISGSGGETGRKGFRTFMEGVRENSPFPLVDVDPSYVAFLFVRAYELCLRKGKTPPQDYLTLKTDVEGVRKEYEKALIYSYLDAKEIAAEDRWLRRVEDLLKVDVLSSWKIDEDQIQPYANQIREAGESKIVLSAVQKQARVQEIYQTAVFELFSGEQRLLYQRRLEEMAYYLLKLGKHEEAKISLAAALDLEKPLNTFQPNPFLFQLVTRSILTLLAEAYEEKKKETSFIVRP
jgi:hypothetical protein